MIEVSGPERRDRRRTTQGLRLCYINIPGTGGDDVIEGLQQANVLRAELPYMTAADYGKKYRVNNTVRIATMRHPRTWIAQVWRSPSASLICASK